MHQGDHARSGACRARAARWGAPETRAAGDVWHPSDRILRSYSAFLLELLCVVLVTLCLAACLNCAACTCHLQLRPHYQQTAVTVCTRFFPTWASPALMLRTIFKVWIIIDVCCGKYVFYCAQRALCPIVVLSSGSAARAGVPLPACRDLSSLCIHVAYGAHVRHKHFGRTLLGTAGAAGRAANAPLLLLAAVSCVASRSHSKLPASATCRYDECMLKLELFCLTMYQLFLVV